MSCYYSGQLNLSPIRLGFPGYQPRVLLATIRNLGKCPCPRCTVPRSQIPDLGTRNDMARRQNLARISDHVLDSKVKRARTAIYERGKGVKSTAVEDQLASDSYIRKNPTL